VILLALEYLGHKVEQKDVDVFVQKTMTDIISEWVEGNWGAVGGKCKD